ncbi:MAG: NHLP family bacteriocin export ABC transporter peptidase/permease/ATPase, partial [Acidobacteria bacterium]|nr:NHLP family bacteriocin export ABC transporter peptidase/permease/ATPase [Acidobacteriota bacterium]
MGLASGRERRRRVRTPPLLQNDQTECGAISLGIVLAFFGRWVPIEELRAACAVTRDGSNGADIWRAAREFGLEVRGWRREPHQLHRMRMPLILYWKFSHFLVLEGHARGRYYVNDPATGRRTIEEDEFDEAFTGVALSFEPGSNFEPGGRRPGIVRRLWPWLRDGKAPLAFALACGLLLSLTALA